MKRVGGLYGAMLARENILLAFLRAAKGKRYRAEVRKFQDDLPDWLASIAQRVSSGCFSFGRFHQFLIRDPKERIITAPCFEERVVHHAIMNVCAAPSHNIRHFCVRELGAMSKVNPALSIRVIKELGSILRWPIY